MYNIEFRVFFLAAMETACQQNNEAHHQASRTDPADTDMGTTDMGTTDMNEAEAEAFRQQMRLEARSDLARHAENLRNGGGGGRLEAIVNDEIAHRERVAALLERVKTEECWDRVQEIDAGAGVVDRELDSRYRKMLDVARDPLDPVARASLQQDVHPCAEVARLDWATLNALFARRSESKGIDKGRIAYAKDVLTHYPGAADVLREGILGCEWRMRPADGVIDMLLKLPPMFAHAKQLEDGGLLPGGVFSAAVERALEAAEQDRTAQVTMAAAGTSSREASVAAVQALFVWSCAWMKAAATTLTTHNAFVRTHLRAMPKYAELMTKLASNAAFYLLHLPPAAKMTDHALMEMCCFLKASNDVGSVFTDALGPK